MAKRWLLAKRFKMKVYRAKARGVKERRSSEKVNTGATPNKEVMSWYRNSARWLSVPMSELYRYNRQPMSDARQAVKDLINDTKDNNARPEWWYFRLVDDGWLRARMYFSNDHNSERCCVVEFSPKTSLSRRSIVYRNRDVAYQRWCEETIDWVDPSEFYHPNIPETFAAKSEMT